ncbi:Innexin [Aphelenchoides fujianensis]|nr:Innexin [Aphelenchoides fujianensis]
MSAHMGAISSVSALINKVFTQPKGDLAGRLNSRITVAILAVSAGLLLSTHFWGDPITCWTPAEFPKIWTDFVNQFCYVEGTYYSDMKLPLEYSEEHRQRNFINYYQWVRSALWGLFEGDCRCPTSSPLQAFFFYMPRFVWKSLSSFSGFDLSGCIQYVDAIWHQVRASNFQGRMDVLEKQAAVYVWDGIRLARRHHRGQMVAYYVFYTVIQTCNAFLMFYLLNELIDSPLYSFSGPSVIADLLQGRSWQETGHFPRITHCDIPRRMLAATPKQTVNCALTLNIYYEKLLLFLWFWMFFVCVVSGANCVSWLMTMCMPERSQRRLRSYLTVHKGSLYLGELHASVGRRRGLHFASDRVEHRRSTGQVGGCWAEGENVLDSSYLSLALYNVVIEFDQETRRLIERETKEV